MRILLGLLLLLLALPLAAETAGLVELIRLDPRLQLDIRYATADNFMHRPLYREARAFLLEPAARALMRAHDKLRLRGYGLRIFDGYRPLRVTQAMWDETPPEKRIFVADPAQGSRHNRGCAVDLTLVDLKTGKPVEMPSGYDEFTERANIDYKGGSKVARAHRDLLRRFMESCGFRVYAPEWWHYDFQGWERHPVLDLDFTDLTPSP